MWVGFQGICVSKEEKAVLLQYFILPKRVPTVVLSVYDA